MEQQIAAQGKLLRLEVANHRRSRLALENPNLPKVLNLESTPGVQSQYNGGTTATTTDSIATKLKQASEGWLFSTESDAPFEVEEWKMQEEFTAAKLLPLTNHPPDAPVEVASASEFFAIAL